MIKKFRKKPVVIEALQYEGFEVNGEECERFLGDSFNSHIPTLDKIEISTLEGPIVASVGDWIIKGVQGEFYPCKPEIFQSTYDEVAGE